jgi:hypothetical protein
MVILTIQNFVLLYWSTSTRPSGGPDRRVRVHTHREVMQQCVCTSVHTGERCFVCVQYKLYCVFANK